MNKEPVCRCRTTKELGVGPLVMVDGITLVEDSAVGDYWWCPYRIEEQKIFDVIAFNRELKPGDHFAIVLRDDRLNPTERLDVSIIKHIAPDTRFNVRTGEVVK